MSGVVQMVMRVDDELAGEVDRLVATGRFESRSDAVRQFIRDGVDRERRAEIGRQIVAGYERVPETPQEMARAFEATRAMIAEEPW